MSDDPVFDSRPWSERVRFDPGGGFAYVPNTAIVRDSSVDEETLTSVLAEAESLGFVDEPTKEFRTLRGKFDVIRVVAHLRAKGIDAQPDHVLFAHAATCCCCGPHPATCFDAMLSANPLHANPLHANPLHANPLHANPCMRTRPIRTAPPAARRGPPMSRDGIRRTHRQACPPLRPDPRRSSCSTPVSPAGPTFPNSWVARQV